MNNVLKAALALRDDCAARLNRAIASLEKCQAFFSKAQEDHQKSLADVAENPSKEGLQRANECATSVMNAKAALQLAEAVVTAVRRELSDHECRIAAARRSEAKEELQRQFASPWFEETVQPAAEEAVHCILGLRNALATLHRAMTDDKDLADKLREFGEEIAERDSTCIAAYVAQALLDYQGVHPTNGDNDLRYAFETPRYGQEYPLAKIAGLLADAFRPWSGDNHVARRRKLQQEAERVGVRKL